MKDKAITIYSKDGCIFCEKAVALLESKGLHCVVYKLDRDFTREGIKNAFPYAKTFPIIFLDNSFIGGYNELVELMKESENDQGNHQRATGY